MVIKNKDVTGSKLETMIARLRKMLKDRRWRTREARLKSLLADAVELGRLSWAQDRLIRRIYAEKR